MNKFKDLTEKWNKEKEKAIDYEVSIEKLNA